MVYWQKEYNISIQNVKTGTKMTVYFRTETFSIFQVNNYTRWRVKIYEAKLFECKNEKIFHIYNLKSNSNSIPKINLPNQTNQKIKHISSQVSSIDSRYLFNTNQYKTKRCGSLHLHPVTRKHGRWMPLASSVRLWRTW